MKIDNVSQDHLLELIVKLHFILGLIENWKKELLKSLVGTMIILWSMQLIHNFFSLIEYYVIWIRFNFMQCIELVLKLVKLWII